MQSHNKSLESQVQLWKAKAEEAPQKKPGSTMNQTNNNLRPPEPLQEGNYISRR